MRHRLAAGLGIIALLVSCDALVDPRPCTLATCNNGLRVNIDGTGTDWADGDYTLELSLGAREHHCTFSLGPGQPAQLGMPSIALDCVPALTGAMGATLGTYLSDFCTADPDGRAPAGAPDAGASDAGAPSAATETPSEAPHACGHFIFLEAPEMPEQVSVRLALGDTVLVEGSRNVAYDVVAPNGLECGPVCRRAEESFVVE